MNRSFTGEDRVLVFPAPCPKNENPEFGRAGGGGASVPNRYSQIRGIKWPTGGEGA